MIVGPYVKASDSKRYVVSKKKVALNPDLSGRFPASYGETAFFIQTALLRYSLARPNRQPPKRHPTVADRFRIDFALLL